MNTTTSIDSALAFILSSYQAPTSSDIVKVVVKAGKVSRVKGTALPNAAAEVKGATIPSSNGAKPFIVESTTTPSSKPAIVSEPLPLAGTLDAKGFLRTIRSAKGRDESIRAIAAYIGYKSGEAFGTQEYVARSQAMREIRNQSAQGFEVSQGPTRQESRRAMQTVKGYVAGMPDAMAREIQDLTGRERLAYSEIQSLRKKQEDSHCENQKSLYAGLILLEEERIQVIAAQLAKLV